MVDFVTLILGLVLGPRVVEVSITEPVVAVEVHLDGKAVARREAPPWTFPVDFGEALLPHRLEAVAFDGSGAEVDRALQWINYGRGSWEASIALEPSDQAVGRRGRVVWATADRRPPVSIDLSFDGRDLPVAADGGFTLPRYDPEEAHHLSAEVHFERNRSANAEAIFGGIYGELTSALTAVPIVLDEGAELPEPEVLSGWFRVGDGPTKVFSTQTEAPAILLVRDHHIGQDLEILKRKRREKFFAAPGKFLHRDFRVTYVLTHELPQDPQGVFRTLWVPDEYYGGGLWNILEQYHPNVNVPYPQHLWWSLVVAGERLSDSRRPRAVVLALSKRPKDHGELPFEQATRYLDAVRAPLFVWAPEAETYQRLGIVPGERSFEGPEGMRAMLEALQLHLSRQWVVWVEGQHLPSEIHLTDAARGIRFAR